MPSPVGHLLAGTAVYLASRVQTRRTRLLLAVSLLGSIAPDFDFVPGILMGDMRTFHHGISHSLMFAALFGLGTFLAVMRLDRGVASRAALLGCLAYASHALLDLVSVNTGTRGVPLLWPVSQQALGVPLGLFGHFRYGGIGDGIWSVVRTENLSPLLRELTILGGLALTFLSRAQIGETFRILRRRVARRR